jgi:alginate O-acetyltransferase complex protein AlgI
MLFNSYFFIFCFLPITFIGFFLLARKSTQLAAIWLTGASIFFYGWWNPIFVFLLIASITINYSLGYAIGLARIKSEKRAKKILTISVLANLGLLAYFKYYNFFIANFNSLTGNNSSILDIVLPLGISFFTFTQIAFLVDVYRGIAREYNFLHYVLFITYFPHLIAGPVLHHKQMMPQFEQRLTYYLNIENINIGLVIFTIGLAKKVLLADQFSLYANPVFDVVENGGEPKLFEAWIGALAYTLQLYFDFSGYSDMAIGLSLLFNVKIPINFYSPYKSHNIIEFWRRWHMTLSTFLRDYLYIPLGGNRKGVVKRYSNILLTMLLGGLWHGAGWTFVIWGGLHGFYLVINHLWQQIIPVTEKHSVWLKCSGVMLTFILVVIAWVPFRSTDMSSALRIWAGMFGINGISLPPSLSLHFPVYLSPMASFEGLTPLTNLVSKDAINSILIGLVVIWIFPNTQQLINKFKSKNESKFFTLFYWKNANNYSFLPGILVGLLFAISLGFFNRFSPFLYFQF